MKLKQCGKWWGAVGLALVTFGGVEAADAGILKASPAKASEFVDQGRGMQKDRSVPFNRFWRNPDPKAWQRAAGKQEIAVNPVSTQHFRGKNRKAAEEMGSYMQKRFQSELGKSGYKVAQAPGKGSLVWDLSLVELKGSNVPGNILKTGASVVVPGAGLVGGRLTQGRVAIEGKLRNAETGEVLIKFTDAAEEKLSPFSFRDFTPYAHSRKAVNHWAKDLSKLSKDPRSAQIAASAPISLNPF